MNIQYYIISYDDAKRLGVLGYRQGNAEDGYLVNRGDMSCATQDFFDRAREVSEKEAKDFILKIRKK